MSSPVDTQSGPLVHVFFALEAVSGIRATHIDKSRTGVQLLLRALIHRQRQTAVRDDDAIDLIEALTRLDDANLTKSDVHGSLAYAHAGVILRVSQDAKLLLSQLLESQKLGTMKDIPA